MRWLMIGLLVSLGALLLAAAGMAHHIWRHRNRPPLAAPPDNLAAVDETDLESEP